MKLFRHLIGAFVLLSLAACNSMYVEYFPFQESEDSYWGLIDHKGNVLFADEFENKIVSVSDGVLCTTDDDGLYQYYTVEKKPRLIAEGFKSAGNFHEGLAPVAMKDEWIKFIDKKGKVAFELKEIDGKQVEWVSNFHFGVAIYHLEDGSEGLINAKGETLSEPRQVNINFCVEGRHYDYSEFCNFGDYRDFHLDGMVIDNENLVVGYPNGTLLIHYKDFIDENFDKALCRLDNEKREIRFYKNSKYYCVETDKKHLIMDGRKEVLSVTKDSKKNCIEDIMGKYLLFHSEYGKPGIMDMKGNIIIRPNKYNIMNFMDEKTLICWPHDGGCKVIDVNENVINDNIDISWEWYLYPSKFYLRDGVTWLADADNAFYFVDKTGEPISNTTYYRITIPNERTAESNLFSIKKLIKEFEIKESGIGGVSINNTVNEFVRFDTYASSYSRGDINDYVREETIEFNKYINDVRVDYCAIFDRYIAINAVSEYGGESLWNTDAELMNLIIALNFAEDLAGKGETIYSGLREYFASHCTNNIKGLSPEGYNACLFNLKNSKLLLLVHFKDYKEEAVVFVYYNNTEVFTDEMFNKFAKELFTTNP